MKTPKYFFSPQPNSQTANKYITNFYESLAKKVDVVNYNKRPIAVSIDILRYAFKTDYMVLNWPEDIMHLRFGLMQMLISTIGLFFFHVKGGTIIWICHNKESHVKKYPFLRNLVRKFFTRLARIIIVHSESATDYFEKDKKKVFFLNHPVYEKTMHNEKGQYILETDVLIWGNIIPYKGLSTFIKKYKSEKIKFNVKIIGKANKKYFEHLKSLATETNITLEDRYLNDEELFHHFTKAKIILLPYLDSDTFSSGALIHSLVSNKIIIGPSVGNFLDLHKHKACLVYDSYYQLFQMVDDLLKNKDHYESTLQELQSGISTFTNSNTWDKFINTLLLLVERKKLDKIEYHKIMMQESAK